MNARLAALLTAAHAPRWRRRYGVEFHALLEELPATPAIVASAAASALTTRLPALAAAGALALAAAVLALIPVASDRRSEMAQAPWPAGLTCRYVLAHTAPDGSIRC